MPQHQQESVSAMSSEAVPADVFALASRPTSTRTIYLDFDGATYSGTRWNGGAEIVALLKTGSAFYAPAASAFEMVDAILRDRRRVLPCATYLQGEYGVDGLFVGVPVVLGHGGLQRIIEIELTATEQAAFEQSAAAVRELVDKLPA